MCNNKLINIDCITHSKPIKANLGNIFSPFFEPNGLKMSIVSLEISEMGPCFGHA